MCCLDGLGVRLGLLVFGEGPVDAGDGRALSLALAGGDDQGVLDLHKRPDPAVRLRPTVRRAALLDRIAVEEGRPETAVQAEEARALVAQLRAEIEGTA